MVHHPFSPSSLDRLKTCPASYNFSKGIEDVKTEISNYGDRMHLVMETGDISNLEPAEVETIEKASEQEELFLNKFLSQGFKVVEQKSEIKLRLISGYSVLTEGYIDKLIMLEMDGLKIALLIDYKFGFKKVSIESLQIETYAQMVLQAFDVARVETKIIQPNIFNYPEKAVFKDAAIIREISFIIQEAKGRYAPFNPSEPACRYCKGLLTCPYSKKAEDCLTSKPRSLKDFSDLEIIEMYEKYHIIKKNGESYKTELKRRVEATENREFDEHVGYEGICGYSIKTKKGNREILDAGAVYNKISDLITPQEFISLTSLSITKLEGKLAPIIQVEKGLKTKKQAKEFLGLKIDSLVTHKKDKEELFKSEN